MMNKEMLAELGKLVDDAALLGCTLLLEQRANLIEYTAKGKIKASYLYDYTDPDCTAQIRAQLNQISTSLRLEWEPEFQRVAPALQTLNWTMEFGYTDVSITDADGTTTFYPYNGEGLQGLTDDISDFLLEQYAEKSEPHDPQKSVYNQGNKNNGKNNAKKPDNQPDTEEPEAERMKPETYICLAGMHIIDLDQILMEIQQSHCGSHQCQGCGNQHCQQDHQLIETLWYHISPEEQQKLMESLSPEKREVIKQCLNRK